MLGKALFSLQNLIILSAKVLCYYTNSCLFVWLYLNYYSNFSYFDINVTDSFNYMFFLSNNTYIVLSLYLNIN